MAQRQQPYSNVRLEGFVGIDQRSHTADVPPTFLRKAYNVDITRDGSVQRRKGVSLVGAGGHSGYATREGRIFYVRGSDNMLCRLYEDGSVTALDQFGSGAPVSYAQIDERVFCSNGTDSRVITGVDAALPWTFPTPPTPKTSGSGDRFVRVVAVFGNNEESAPSKTVQCDSGETIQIAGHSGALGFSVYVTFKNGTEFYYHGAVGSGGGSYLIGDHRPGAHALPTHNTIQFPAGWRLASFYRRVLSARDNVLWFSSLESPHLAGLNDFFQFENNITLIAPLEGGCYIGTEAGLYWLDGEDPSVWSRRKVAAGYVLVQRVAKRLSSDILPLEGSPQVAESTAIWIDDELIIGRIGGSISRVSRDRIAPDIYRAVTVSVRAVDGIRQIVSRFSEKAGESRYRAQDPTVTDYYNRPKGI